MATPPRHSSRLLAGLAFALAFGGAARADDLLGGPSPFLPSAAAAGAGGAVTPTPDTPIELRGIMQSPAGTMFSIFDPSRRTSSWVRLDEPGRDFIVRRYDDKNDAISVDYQGRNVTLTLRTAKVATAPGGNAPGAGPTPPPPAGAPVALNPTPADEQRRLEAIAAEVNRRRQLRQQALRQQQQQRQQPPGNPAPPQQR